MHFCGSQWKADPNAPATGRRQGQWHPIQEQAKGSGWPDPQSYFGRNRRRLAGNRRRPSGCFGRSLRTLLSANNSQNQRR